VVRTGSGVAALRSVRFMYYDNGMASISVTRKKRGRPATGQDPVRTVRLPDDIIEAVDEAASREDPPLSRSEMIRRILSEWLRKKGYRE